jgi:hypothetical protein
MSCPVRSLPIVGAVAKAEAVPSRQVKGHRSKKTSKTRIIHSPFHTKIRIPKNDGLILTYACI